MTGRQKALLASSPGVVVLLASLAWAIGDRIHLHAADRGIRVLDRLHELVHL